jgi:hypothetical protein
MRTCTKLSKQPALIYVKQIEYVNAIAAYNAASVSLDNETLQIDCSVGFDETLKNEHQRRAKRAQMMLRPGFQGLQSDVLRLKQAMGICEAEYLKIRRSFDVMKIQASSGVDRAGKLPESI